MFDSTGEMAAKQQLSLATIKIAQKFQPAKSLITTATFVVLPLMPGGAQRMALVGTVVHKSPRRLTGTKPQDTFLPQKKPYAGRSGTQINSMVELLI